MAQMVLSHCNCCGLEVDLTQVEVCPNCQYPVKPEKERHFLEASIYDLRRVMHYGGASITVSDLVRRYEGRLQFLPGLRTQTSKPLAVSASVPESIPTQTQTRVEEPLSASPVGKIALPVPASIAPPTATQPAAPALATGSARGGFSFSSDALINLVATLGGFLVLAGSLSFVLTTSSLWLSFIAIFLLHAAFGGTGVFTRRRFPLLRAVSTLYTLIFVLLVPLVGFSAYRLATNGLVELSTPLLLLLASLYAAVIYSLLAVVQRFVPFAYLGMVALFVADLALAQALHLAFWWWPCIAMLLALVGLTAVAGFSDDSSRLFAGERTILRTPLRVLMYAVVWATIPLTLFTLVYSLAVDAEGQPVQEIRLALLSLSCLVFLWTALWIWRTRRTSGTPLLAYLLLGTFLLLGYALNLDQTGYVMLLASVALLYHALVRATGVRLATYGLPALTLDRLAIGLSVLVVLLAAFATPFQLLYSAYAGSSAQSGLSSLIGPFLSLSFVPGAGIAFDLLAPGICLLVTIDIALTRAGWSRTPTRAGWCWLLLLSGSLLASVCGLGILLGHVNPLWAFLTLSSGLLACAILVRRFTSSAWANPLDILVLCSLTSTLLLSLGQTREVISGFLLGFAALLYIVLLYQHRPLPSLYSALLLLLALPLLLDHPIVVLGLGLLLPLLTAGMQRTRLFGDNYSVSLFASALLVPALFYGLFLTNAEVNSGQSAFANWSGIQLTAAYEIAALGIAWYAAALLTRVKLWLVPATLFWLFALLLPTNNFWALAALTPFLAILAALIERRVSVQWALPFYLAALFGVGMVGYTGLLQQHVTETSWFLLGFALLAYGIGLLNGHVVALWLTPLFAVPAVFIAATLLGDLYRPPLVAIACAGLGVVGSRAAWPVLMRLRKHGSLLYGLPFYVTALVAALLTGIYGALGDINRPFYGALPDALLVYALVAFAVLRIEQRPRWSWLVAVFACWSVLLAQRLTVPYVLGSGVGLALLGVLSGRVFRPVPVTAGTGRSRTLDVFAWSWPWYSAFLVATLILGTWSATSGQAFATDLIVPGMLIFTLLAVGVMLVERSPELLLFPAGLAAWTIALWLPLSEPAALISAYTLLCASIFAAQFIWRILPPATRWLPETSLHNLLSLGGLCLVLLISFSLGALSTGAGLLTQAGVLALVILSLLLFLYGLAHPATVARALPQTMDAPKRTERLSVAHAVQHWCYYTAGLLLSLVVSWELLAFNQTRFDALTLVPASYLIVLAPFLLRDQVLRAQHAAGQVTALLGAALLLLPALWFSFNGSDLLPTLILLGESLILLALGLIIRLRIFVLSSAALLIIGTLRVLFLSIPPSVPILLMVFGSLLIVLATVLILSRHRLQTAWERWE